METHLSRRCAGAGTRCRYMPGVWAVKPIVSCRPLRRLTLVAANPSVRLLAQGAHHQHVHVACWAPMHVRRVPCAFRRQGPLRPITLVAASATDDAGELTAVRQKIEACEEDLKGLPKGDPAWAALQQRLAALETKENILLQQAAVVKPEGKLLRYLTGLAEEERVDVFSKLAAAGYAAVGREDKVDTLSNDNLKEMGIEPQALRSELLKAFALCGPSKVVVLVDDTGNEEDVEFEDRRAFELWAATNTLKLTPTGGHKKYIKTWERLQDGGRYYTTRTLENTVADLENYQKSQDKGLEDKVAEKALADMRQHHKEARRLFCGKGGVLHNKRVCTKRQIDEIILADNCYQVLEVKQVVDPDAAEQLRSGMEFIKQGIEDGEADFAKRSDGTLREMKGALGGLLMVSGNQNQQEVKQRVAQGGWGMYLLGGGRMGNGSSCHEVPALVQCEAPSSVASAAAPPPAQSA